MKNYTNRISALKSTTIDVRILDAKKITLNGENILDKTKVNVLDERGTLANDELDIWNSYITTDTKNNFVIDNTTTPISHTHGKFSSTEQKSILQNTSKIINNEILDDSNKHLMYWQTNGLTDGYWLFKDNTNIKSVQSDFSSLIKGTTMFYGCTNLTTFEGDLSSLDDSINMFYGCTLLSTFNSNLDNLTKAQSMFRNCTSMTSFNIDLPNLTYVNGTFGGCTSLSSFKSDLSSLTDAEGMFSGCSSLIEFKSNLLSLENGSVMFFQCSNLESFNLDMPSLTNGSQMFRWNSNLVSFTSNLKSLTNGEHMFGICPKFTTFKANLSSLTNGGYMFHNCKLDSQSVSNIIHFLPTHETEGTITIGIGITNNDDLKQQFAEECFCDSWQELNDDFTAKNWIVEWQFNGPVTFDLRTPQIPVYAKLEEVSDGNMSEYTSEDGSKFYNLDWFHETTGSTDGYTLFNSLGEAISTFNIKQIEK